MKYADVLGLLLLSHTSALAAQVLRLSLSLGIGRVGGWGGLVCLVDRRAEMHGSGPIFPAFWAPYLPLCYKAFE
eukprot:COSAG04_NODE_462_length_13972_cov_67.880992_9_plen_74_part_00